MKRVTKIIIIFGLFLLLQLFVTGMAFKLSAEAKVTKAYTNGVTVTAVDHCSNFAIKKGKHYIEFCDYNFKPLDNESSEYYIFLLENTYFVTTDSKAYITVLAAIENKRYDIAFQSLMKYAVMIGNYGDWNVLGYLENNPIFGWTFVPNKNLTTYCKKNKVNRYYFGGNK